MAFGYEIEKGNVVVIWADEKGTPGNVVQEAWPDGTKWKDKAEAEAWAKAFIKAAQDDKAPRPGNGPDAKTLKIADLELTAEEIAAGEAARAAIAAEAEVIAAIVAERDAALAFELENPTMEGNKPELTEDVVDAEEVTE